MRMDRCWCLRGPAFQAPSWAEVSHRPCAGHLPEVEARQVLSPGSAGNRAACGSYVTLSGFWLPFTAQQKEMSFATMETGGSPSLLSWHQVSRLWCPDRVGAAPMLGIPCSFQRPGYCCFALLELDF